MRLFSAKSQNEKNEEKREHCFFIPIVEQIKESDYDQSQSFSLVKQTNLRRKFYSNTELLQQSESARLLKGSQLSCYKVMLKESERQQLQALNTQGTFFAAFLSFAATDIESLIIFKPDNPIELINPFYQHERTNEAVPRP